MTARVERAQITVFDGDISTDVSSTTPGTDSTYSGRRVRQFRPPYLMSVTQADAATTSPGGTNYSVTVQMQESVDGGTTWTDITDWKATFTAPGAATKRVAHAGQVGLSLRAVRYGTAGTWNGGSTLTAVVTGEGIA